MNHILLDRRLLLKTAGLATGSLALGPYADAYAKVGRPLHFHTEHPPNAEPGLLDLIGSWKTANEHFYIRSHADAPLLDAGEFKVSIEGMVRRQATLTAAELQQRFPAHRVDVTMTCAGNRRNEHSRIKPVAGVAWMAGAIGNATWGGIALSDLLRSMEPTPDAKYVWFEGADEIDRSSTTIPFGASIPIDKAMARHGEMPGALIAFEMNGQPLSADHGFPMRTVVPGYIGARSVKWLRRIVLSDRPSPNYYVAKAYKLVTDSTPAQWSGSDPILEYRTNGVICTPSPDSKIEGGRIQVRGYALAEGKPGVTVSNVSLSADGGATWSDADLIDTAKPFCWQRWSTDLPIADSCEELVVRVTDSNGHAQPEKLEWNLKGYLCNAWHRVPVQVGR